MNGPIAWFARNHIAANLLLAVMVLAGLLSLPIMPQKDFPDLDYKLITVSVRHLGAAPGLSAWGVTGSSPSPLCPGVFAATLFL